MQLDEKKKIIPHSVLLNYIVDFYIYMEKNYIQTKFISFSSVKSSIVESYHNIFYHVCLIYHCNIHNRNENFPKSVYFS